MSIASTQVNSQSALSVKRPEILAPAGNEEMMKAAVENGADAVYFGLHQFNARLRAANFDAAELPRLVSWLHERGVKAYVTLNTLIFCGEMELAADLLIACSNAGVDAVLVQDMGLARLAKSLVPELPLHASTQMTLTCAESIAAIERMGIDVERIVAARELSRRELEKITSATEKEIEVFVHGAICVAYSGQCLTSESLGGRSANRGECAQACRLPYDLVVDGETHDLGDIKYLLSPRDLAAYEDIGDLIRHGIVSFKIEGRYKSPEYVAATVQSYRAAIDSAMQGTDPKLDGAAREKLEMAFSRGFTGGYLHEINHQDVVEGRFPKKRGLYLGRVIDVTREGALVRLENPLKSGDGIVFDAGSPDRPEEGGRVYHVVIDGKMLKAYSPASPGQQVDALLTFGRGAVDFRKVKSGQLVWKTDDPKLNAELRASFDGDEIRHRRPVRLLAAAKAGAPLTLTMWDDEGAHVEVTDTEPAQSAINRPLTSQLLAEQFGRLGGTPFFLESLDARIEGSVMVPVSRMNALRRKAVEELIRVRRERNRDRPIHSEALKELRGQIASATREAIPHASESQLAVLCRTLEQVEAAAAHDGVRTIYTDFEDLRLHRTAREIVGPRQRFVPATLRIMKPGESPIARKLLDAQPDAILIRNLASWQVLRDLRPDLPMIADFSLNVSNDCSAWVHFQQGFHVLTPSYDLNYEQLNDLLACTPPEWYEITIHQYMPMFHMEHCVFCRFLSDGTDYTNCGRPCEKHQVALRDRMGYAHRLKADMGCRNTVFNAVAQSASEYLGGMLKAGVRHFRVDLLDEDRAGATSVIETYLPAIRGECGGHDLWKRLRAKSKLGVTRGSFDYE